MISELFQILKNILDLDLILVYYIKLAPLDPEVVWDLRIEP